MFLFNLSLAEFLTIFTALSSFVVLLYLLDRSRRKQIVATLRFWKTSDLPNKHKHRKRIQQPLSLILQLIAIALLLLAIAQLRLGSPDRSSRDHVILVDASAWMQAQPAAGRTLMQDARVSALRYVRALPSSDRVMIVRADGLATPLTGFESNKSLLESSIRQIQPSSAALELAHSVRFAQKALSLEGKRSGEIVYVGPGRMSQEAASQVQAPPNMRILPVTHEVENAGVKRMSLRRSPNDPELWDVSVAVRNYGVRPRSIPLVVAFGGAPVGTRRIVLAPGEEQVTAVQFRTKAAGWLEARIQASDSLAADNQVTVELPAVSSIRVVVYTNDPESIRPLLGRNPRLEAIFRTPAQYQPDAKESVVIIDRFRPPSEPTHHAIYLDPPQGASPVPIRTSKQDAAVRWRSEQPLAAGLRTKDARLDSSLVFAPAQGDLTIAETDGGPIVVARPGAKKLAVFGFHPTQSALRFELATPLLFANLLKWMAPEAFLNVELQAGSVGVVATKVESDYDPSAVRVDAGERGALPFTLRDGTLQFFSGHAGLTRVYLPDRELVFSQSLPELGESRWQAPASVRTGFRGVGGIEIASRDLWQWLALAALLILAAEWWFFGGSRSAFPANLVRFPWKRASDENKRKAS